MQVVVFHIWSTLCHWYVELDAHALAEHDVIIIALQFYNIPQCICAVWTQQVLNSCSKRRLAVRYCDTFVSVHQLPCVCEVDVKNFFMSTVVLFATSGKLKWKPKQKPSRWEPRLKQSRSSWSRTEAEHLSSVSDLLISFSILVFKCLCSVQV